MEIYLSTQVPEETKVVVPPIDRQPRLEGIVCTAVGFVCLMVQGTVAWLRSGRKIKIKWKIAGKVLYGVSAALVLGTGMCMIMVWNLMLPGIAVGILGMILLLMLIPMCIGLK